MRPGSVSKSVFILFILIISLVVLNGCIVHSVNPFYSKESIADMPALNGKWILKEGKTEEGLNREWLFSADKITIPDFKGSSATLSSRFFRVDDMLFLDAIADSPPEVLSFWWVLHVTPVHTVSRVILEEKTMKIIPLDASWMEAAVKNKTVSLPSVWHQEQKTYLFTATAAEWADFLKKYGKDQNVFMEKEAFVFVRP
ncbi:MAG: hypothetical protein HZB62_12110 [Nitrospirae bacterium]|nr:hypothetical protein [Nitrospirota bacterium]